LERVCWNGDSHNASKGAVKGAHKMPGQPGRWIVKRASVFTYDVIVMGVNIELQ